VVRRLEVPCLEGVMILLVGIERSAPHVSRSSNAVVCRLGAFFSDRSVHDRRYQGVMNGEVRFGIESRVSVN
jgi:hypothetical protein